MISDWDESGSGEHWPHRLITYQMFRASIDSTHATASGAIRPPALHDQIPGFSVIVNDRGA
jgi:hypothetical protein